MNTSLRFTKIQLPPLQSGHIKRSRLLQALSHKPDARLILVSAPAGFGKTSCMIEWCQEQVTAGTRLIWYALDQQDNDPARFVSYLSAACRQISLLSSGEHLNGHSDQVSNLDDLTTQIVNTLLTTEERWLFAFDDYHLITAPEIHAALSLMLEHLPANAQLAIASRADPPLPLSRLRARGQITELRLADLRFNPTEIDALFQDALHRKLPQDEVRQLDEKSEGWAAALRLMTLALASPTAEMVGSAIRQLLSPYSSVQRHIFDYLADEVFEQQSLEVQRFLLDTSVLTQLSPPLCQWLTEDSAAPLLLDRLAHHRLFVIRLSETEPIYRYHHLFEEFLRQRLRLEDEGRCQALHCRAARWYEDHDDIVMAVHHALEARDYPYAARLITEKAWEVLTSRGEIVTIVSWIPRFPEVDLNHQPRLCLCFSRAQYLMGDISASAHHLQSAVTAIEQMEGDQADVLQLRTVMLNYQATLAGYAGQVSAGLALTTSALEHLDTVEPIAQVRLLNTAGYLHFLVGKIDPSRGYYEQAAKLAEQQGHAFLAIDAHYYLAQLDRIKGRLGAVQERCEAQLTEYPHHFAPIGAVMIPLALVHYERNDVIKAEGLLRDAIHMARKGGLSDVHWYSSLQLGGILATQGRFEEAESFITQARSSAVGFQSPVMRSLIQATNARLLLYKRSMEEAAQWADDFLHAKPFEHLTMYEEFTHTRVHLAQGQTDAVLLSLEAILDDAQRDERDGHVLEALVLRSLALSLRGDRRASIDSLRAALRIAEPEGYIRLFLDEGQPMLHLLTEIAERGKSTSYATFLLQQAKKADQPLHPADRLSERELEVLRWMAQGASNQEIADHLVIGIGTVKSHINHIMVKLDARNRTEAVAKARSLNLVAD